MTKGRISSNFVYVNYSLFVRIYKVFWKLVFLLQLKEAKSPIKAKIRHLT